MSARWKVRKLEDGRWSYSAPGCPDRPHFCWRWLSMRPCCGSKLTLAAAYDTAAEHCRREAMEDYMDATRDKMAGLASRVRVGDYAPLVTDPSRPLPLWGQDRA